MRTFEVGTKFATKFWDEEPQTGEVVQVHKYGGGFLYTVKMERAGTMLVAFTDSFDVEDDKGLWAAQFAMNPCSVPDYEDQVFVDNTIYNEHYAGGLFPILD